MARQCSPFPFTGTIGSLTFYLHPDDGYLVKGISQANPDKVLTHEDYQLTRDNAEDFRKAIMNGSLFRRALLSIVRNIADGKLSSRMNKVFHDILKTDNTHHRGERSILCGNMEILKGFNFNRNASLDSLFHVRYSTYVDKETGVACIEIPEFIPQASLEPVVASKHFSIISELVVLDFEKDKYQKQYFMSPLYEIGLEPVNAIRIEHAAMPEIDPGKCVVLTLGIVFHARPDDIPKGTISKRKTYRLKGNTTYNELVGYTGALEVVEVWRVENPV